MRIAPELSLYRFAFFPFEYRLLACQSFEPPQLLMPEASNPSPLNTDIFRDAFNAIPVGIAIENPEGHLVFANSALCSMLGFSADELCGTHCAPFSPPEDAERDSLHFQQLKAGSIEHYQIEKRYFRRDGSLMWGQLSLSVLSKLPSPLFIAMVTDITEKKSADHARFRHIAFVESSEDAIASVTLAGFIESWNVGAQRMFGYTDIEAVGKPVTILVPPELPDEEKNILETLRAGGRIEHFETVRVTKGGERINVSLTISPIKDLTGHVVGYSGIARDITERKKAELSLHESEERLRLAVHAGRMFAYSWDAATDVIERSGESEKILGIAKEKVITGAEVLAMVHHDDKERLEAALAKLSVESPTLHLAYRILRPDSVVVWLERNSRAYFDEFGKVKRVVGMIVDITERKRAEGKLREYERAVEGSEEMIAVVDREYRYLIANRQFLKLRKMTREQVVGHLASEVLNDGVFEGLIKAKLDECFEGKVVRYEMKYTYPDLGERDLLVSYFPIEGTSGFDRVACILQDITERKHMEKALSTMSRNLLESQELERSRIGRELHDDITQRLVMLSLELEQLQGDPSELQGRVPEFRRRIAELSNDVQALSHDLHPSKLKYLGAVAGIRSWCKEFAERHGMQIAFDSDVSTVVPADVGLPLFRILQEALHNAHKHSGVKRVAVQLREVFSEIQLIVTDAGKGFDITDSVQARGLGLTSMRERVRLANGTINIDSKPMGGTRIDVRLPLGLDVGVERAAV